MKNKYYAKKLEILLLSLCFLCGDACSAAIEDNFEAVEPGFVRVVYFSKKGERYSMTYDVSPGGVCMSMGLFGRKKAIVSLQFALQQEYLKGYILKPGRTELDITDADFSHKNVALRSQNMTTAASADKNVDLQDYSRQWFFSELIENFLVKGCQALAKQGPYSDDSVAALTTDMPKAVRQKYSCKKFSWGIVSYGRALEVAQEFQDKALEVAQEFQDKPQILIFIGGVGVLWGKLTKSGDISPHQRSLHRDKIKGAAKAICTKYPFSKEAWRK